MGVYIKGLEMPRSCAECPVNMNICKRGYKFLLKHMELYDQRANDCPISSVPPHGRLIDADAYEALIRGLGNREYRRENGTICDAIKFLHPYYTPTIIPAEEGE